MSSLWSRIRYSVLFLSGGFLVQPTLCTDLLFLIKFMFLQKNYVNLNKLALWLRGKKFSSEVLPIRSLGFKG